MSDCTHPADRTCLCQLPPLPAPERDGGVWRNDSREGREIEANAFRKLCAERADFGNPPPTSEHASRITIPK
jgi:hypothetical protein